MQDNPEKRTGEGETWTAYVPDQKALGENTFLKFVQRPRIVLALLMAWSLITVIIEAVPESDIFFNVKAYCVYRSLRLFNSSKILLIFMRRSLFMIVLM